MCVGWDTKGSAIVEDDTDSGQRVVLGGGVVWSFLCRILGGLNSPAHHKGTKGRGFCLETWGGLFTFGVCLFVLWVPPVTFL